MFAFQPGAENLVMSLFFYMALDPQGSGSLKPKINKGRLSTIHGFSEELGNFELLFPKAGTNLKKSDYLVTYAPSHNSLMEALIDGIQIKPWDSENHQYLALGGHHVPQQYAQLAPNYIVHQVSNINLSTSVFGQYCLDSIYM